MYFYICGCDVAHSVILSLVNSVLPSVSPVSTLRADKRSYRWVETPATPFLSLFGKLDDQSMPAASTSCVGSFAVPRGRWISVAPATTRYSTLAVNTPLLVLNGVIVPTPSPSMR